MTLIAFLRINDNYCKCTVYRLRNCKEQYKFKVGLRER